LSGETFDTGQILACVGALAGLGGLLTVLAAAPQRGSKASIALLAAFALLLLGGAAGIRGTPVTQAAPSEILLVAGGVVLVVGVLLTISDARTRERAMRLAVGESEARRREIDRLGGTNVLLEDELREVRRRVATLEQKDGGSELSRAARDAGAARQRKAVEAAQASERKHRAIFEGAVEGMAMLERETLRLVNVNPSLARMTGFEAAELGALTLVDLFADGPGQPGKADLQRCAREARALSVEIRQRRPAPDLPESQAG